MLSEISGAQRKAAGIKLRDSDCQQIFIAVQGNVQQIIGGMLQSGLKQIFFQFWVDPGLK